MARILFIGVRSAALRAAEALDAEVLVVGDRPPSKHFSSKVRFLVADMEDCSEKALAHLDAFVRSPPDAVLPIVERGVVLAATLRERWGMDGESVETAKTCHFKPTMKARIQECGLPCARWHVIDSQTTYDHLATSLGVPFVIKKTDGSGSRGLLVIEDQGDIENLPEGWMAESFVHGTEMSIESFVLDSKPLWTNITRYRKPRWSNILPERLGEEEEAVKDFNRQCIRALGITRGMTHLEIFATPSGLYFGELAIRPPGGRIMELIEMAWGFDPWQALINLELGDSVLLPQKAMQCAGVEFLHPGPGIVTGIEGLERAMKIAGVIRVQCSLKEGRQIFEREGTGQNKGAVFAIGESPEEVASRLEEAVGHIRIDVQ